jgi:truncated hemoglobin YjbI
MSYPAKPAATPVERNDIHITHNSAATAVAPLHNPPPLLQRAHQAAFMTYAFGGENHYSGKDMVEAHKNIVPHLTEAHFNAVVENFVATLQELGVPEQDIEDACAIVATTKDAVLAK